MRERVETLLTESGQWTGGKQRLTATRLHELLVAEGKQVGVTVVKAAVAEWKRQRREVFVPLTYRPGDLAEVDFFEVLVDLDGTRRKAWLFLMRLMYSGRDFAWIYERQDQVSFLDGRQTPIGDDTNRQVQLIAPGTTVNFTATSKFATAQDWQMRLSWNR